MRRDFLKKLGLGGLAGLVPAAAVTEEVKQPNEVWSQFDDCQLLTLRGEINEEVVYRGCFLFRQQYGNRPDEILLPRGFKGKDDNYIYSIAICGREIPIYLSVMEAGTMVFQKFGIRGSRYTRAQNVACIPGDEPVPLVEDRTYTIGDNAFSTWRDPKLEFVE